jgi:hypothetical protein
MSFFKKSFVLIAMGVVVAFVCWANRTKAVVKLPPKRQKQPTFPFSSDYSELLSLNRGFAMVLQIASSILRVIIVHSVVTQNRRYRYGEETEGQQDPGRA